MYWLSGGWRILADLAAGASGCSRMYWGPAQAGDSASRGNTDQIGGGQHELQAALPPLSVTCGQSSTVSSTKTGYAAWLLAASLRRARSLSIEYVAQRRQLHALIAGNCS